MALTNELSEFRAFLLCFGSQRGGTTWLDDQLRKHPDFSLPPRKELRFLDPIYVHEFAEIQRQRVKEFRRRLWNATGGEAVKPLDPAQARDLQWNAKYALVAQADYNDDWYRSLFADCDRGRVTGDFSPDYSLLPDEGVARLATLAPDAKLVFSMRDPVDRTLSGASYPLRHHPQMADEEKAAFLERAARSDLQRAFSDYRTILTRYEKYFPAENICIIFHDDIKADPVTALKQVCDHLGLDYQRGGFGDFGAPVNLSPTIEQPSSLRVELSRDYLPLLEWLSEKVGGHAHQWYQTAKSIS